MAEERINCALADTVESHATKDRVGGLRRKLRWIHSGTRHHKGGLSASQPSITTSTDQNTGTGDVTRGTRTGPTQDVTRATNSDDIGDDVVMKGDSADENRAQSRTPEFVDVRRQEKNHNEEGNHVKSEMRKRASPSNTFQQEYRGKIALSEHPVAVTTRGTGRIP